MTIHRLELCGAYLHAQLLSHVKGVMQLPLSSVHACTDSTIILNWLTGNPRRFKTYVRNSVSSIVELIPPDKWNHGEGIENPSNCASLGLFPFELLTIPYRGMDTFGLGKMLHSGLDKSPYLLSTIQMKNESSPFTQQPVASHLY